MIKMIIKMNEDKIITDNAYSVEHVYDVLVSQKIRYRKYKSNDM